MQIGSWHWQGADPLLLNLPPLGLAFSGKDAGGILHARGHFP
jgi:hypothetical protein